MSRARAQLLESAGDEHGATDEEGGGGGRAGVKGSSDAYNLFYVERGYLARQVEAALGADAASYGGVLAEIDSGRDERYEAERE